MAQVFVCETVSHLRSYLTVARKSGKSIGFVPTMGALHAGHVSLMARARNECDVVVVSIFVNPTQFGPNEDFDRYPRPREADLKICGEAGVDFVFYPNVDEVFPAEHRTFVDVPDLSNILEGAIRPGHFRGVATVVAKLFLIVGAELAYFGQKDYQQLLLIRTMTRDLNIPTAVVTCPTMRDSDGMAMSSRNAYLTAQERQRGLCLISALRAIERLIADGERDLVKLKRTLNDVLKSTEGVLVDYAIIADPGTLQELESTKSSMIALVAIRVGTTRLIDNMLLQYATTDRLPNSIEFASH